MPYLKSLPEWLQTSDSLLRAYPTTTRITTKYTIPSASTDPSSTTPTPTPTTTSQSAILTLKTYDPQSGACLKYKTDQAAEVNRVVRSLGLLGQGMAGRFVEDVKGGLEGVVEGEGGGNEKEREKVVVGGEREREEEGGKGKKKRKGKK